MRFVDDPNPHRGRGLGRGALLKQIWRDFLIQSADEAQESITAVFLDANATVDGAKLTQQIVSVSFERFVALADNPQAPDLLCK